MLFDAIRKTITLTSRLCQEHSIDGWRQASYNLLRLKGYWRKAQKSNRSRKVDAEKNKCKAYTAYLRKATHYYEKSLASVEALQKKSEHLEPLEWSALQNNLDNIGVFQGYASMLLDQIDRRVLKNETIPTNEKIYSIFQPHTEWISKGKAGVPVELGVKVCIMEDQFQFILHHQVMENKQDVNVAVSMVTETQKTFPDFKACSFDKGFHSPSNQKALAAFLEDVVLPKKGKCSAEEAKKEKALGFRKARRQHSAVESAINALEHNGLDRCPDHGIEGFKCYVALGILSRNLKRIGSILIEEERALIKPKRQRAQAA